MSELFELDSHFDKHFESQSGRVFMVKSLPVNLDASGSSAPKFDFKFVRIETAIHSTCSLFSYKMLFYKVWKQ